MKNKYFLMVALLFSLLLVGCKEKKTYLVSFETDGATNIETQRVLKGKYAERPINNPKKENFEFINWYKDKEFSEVWLFDQYQIFEDTIIYAKFIQKFTVTYLDDSNNLIEAIVYNENTLIQKPSNPIKVGHTFVGWFFGQTLFNFDEPITRNLVLKAKFEENIQTNEKFTVTYLDDLDNLICEEEYNKNTLIQKPSNPTKEGHSFVGWYLDDTLFNFDEMITKDLVLKARFEEITSDEKFTVTYLDDNDNLIETVEYNKNAEILKPDNPVKEGYVFIGWFLNNTLFTFGKPIADNVILKAKFEQESTSDANFLYGTYLEAIWVELLEENNDVKVEYKRSEDSTFKKLDQELIRVSGGKTLIDIVGLKADSYNVEITINQNEKIRINNIIVKSHDRSGYAHFNYSEGIGAYNNDGTLKEDAIVVYVTEQNKNNISISGINQIGLGWILNNNQYSSANSNTKSETEYNNSLAKFNNPIVFRIIGKITAPEGLTAYNSTDNGGSIGDNGSMARIKDGKHITFEGIGEGAIIEGWGIHFIASTQGRGIGFEVRNITFDKYPEDAVGLEGVQEGDVLTAPVERGWIHNSTFLQGYCANPAESDKGFGDGSLDIKRGQYFTVSYNKFLSAKKTNLVGASDSNLQYHLTYHHNLWENSDSRTPLARKANIHLYNNVFKTTDDNQGEISYAVNPRANAYIFSEANYFFAIKNPFVAASGGVIKSYEDILYSTYGDHHQTIVNSRTEAVPNGNKFSDFDTNSSVFYYDLVNKKTNVIRITDALTAKMEVYAYSGVYRKEIIQINEADHYITNVMPTLITETVENSGGKILKGIPFYVFEINTNATFEMTEGTATYKPRLSNIFGIEMLTGTGSVSLTPGIYVLESEISHGSSKGVSQAKESKVDYFKIEIDTEQARQQRIANFNNALNLIPTTLEYSNETLTSILNAKSLYSVLLPDEQALVDGTKLNNIFNEFVNLGKTYIEGLISDIGVVNEGSYSKISLARTKYDEALDEIKVKITNYQTLNDAEDVYQAFAVSNLINDINNKATYSTVNKHNKESVTTLYNEYESLSIRYENLTIEQQNDVTNYQKVLDNLAELERMLLAHEIKRVTNSMVPVGERLNEIKDAYDNYQTLSESNKEIITAAELTRLNNLYAEYLEIVSSRVEQLYYYSGTNNYFTLESTNSYPVDPPVVYKDISIDLGLKLESATKITFTASTNFRIIMKFTQGESIKINGEVVQIVDGEIVLDLTIGTYLITRDGNPQARLVYMVVIENY